MKTYRRLCLFIGICLLLCVSATAWGEGDLCYVSDPGYHCMLTGHRGEVYCVARTYAGFLQTKYYVLRITGGNVEEVYQTPVYPPQEIRGVHAHEDGLMMVRRIDTLDSLFVKTMYGNCSVDLLNPQTGQTTNWDSYSPDVQRAESFTANNTLYTLRKVGEAYNLERYSGPGEAQAAAQLTVDRNGNNSFCILAYERSPLFKNKVRLTLYDFATGSVCRTQTALKLAEAFENPWNIHAVVKDQVLYYWSKNAIRAYDFTTDQDVRVLRLNGALEAMAGFVLRGDILAAAQADHKVSIYHLGTKQLLQTVTLETSPLYLYIENGTLYAYDGWDQFACVDLEDFTVSEYFLDAYGHQVDGW
ncbi:MAG: hypothetical protein IJF65_02210 [Clostridia bacterium]|nr:hypothetical protein [Clostridia bacterium]